MSNFDDMLQSWVLTCENGWHGVGKEDEQQEKEEAGKICHHFGGIVSNFIENGSQEQADNYVGNNTKLGKVLQKENNSNNQHWNNGS